MIALHPEYLEKNGKKEFAILSVEEFDELKSYIEDMEDLLDLRNAKEEEKDLPSISLSEVKNIFEINR
ncbi:MAG: prevent-host-death family protein [Spirochaetes bacterium GWF1_49_6]|nr:MAG: prevent-host-death family protein [Spirochaetes bacterium GWF1_49_6]